MQGFPKLEKPSFLRGTILEVEARDNILAGERVAIMPTGGNVQLYYTSSISTNVYSSLSQCGVSCSADGSIVAVVRSSAPYVYRWDGTGFTAISLSSNPSGTVYSVAVSPDGRYLAITTDSSPYLYCYEYVNGTFVARSLSANPPYAGAIKFDNDGVLALGVWGNVGPYVYLPGEIFIQIAPDKIMGAYHHALAWGPLASGAKAIYFLYPSSDSYSLYYYLYQNNQLTRASASYSSSYGRVICYNHWLSYMCYSHNSYSYLYAGFPGSGSLRLYTSLTFYAAAAVPLGFLLATSAGIYEYVSTQYSAFNFSIRPTSITSSCNCLAGTPDGQTFFTSVGGYLTVLKYNPNIQYAYKYFNLPGTFYYCIALENIPKGSVGKVILQQ